MAVYVGIMGKGTQIDNSLVVGDAVKILCNPLINPDNVIVGPVKYNIHPFHLELVDYFYPSDPNPGFSHPRNYADVFREIASRRKGDEPLIALFKKEPLPLDCFLDSVYPKEDMVYVARVSSGLKSTLESVGRKFS